MSIEPESATLEVRTEDGGLRKSFGAGSKNVVDTKINLFNTGSRKGKAPVVKSAAQRNNPLMQPRASAP